MIGHLRAVARFIALFSYTLLLFLLWTVSRPFMYRAERRDVSWRLTLFRHWCRFAAALIGMRIAVHGAPPAPPFLLVSNHLSYLDVALLGSQLRGVFVSKAELARWPILGLLCRTALTIFVDRGNKATLSHVVDEIGKRLRSGAGVVLFPEGTTTSGDRLLPFRSPLLESAAAAEQPVWYATIRYRSRPGHPPAEQSLCWWADMTLFDHMYNVFRMPGFDADLIFAERPISAGDRKILAEKLWAAVKQQRERAGTAEE